LDVTVGEETPKKPPKKALKEMAKIQSPVEVKPPPVLITHYDIRTIQITRAKLERWLGEPYWDKVRGLFVRVGVGVTHDSSKPIYKLAEIVGKFSTTQNNNIPHSHFSLSLTYSLTLKITFSKFWKLIFSVFFL
jgi:hypothetical protein